MVGYQAPSYRPAYAAAPKRGPQLGSVTDMNVWDWLLLGGGAVVSGVGVHGLIGQAQSKKPNAIAILINFVLAGVGLTTAVQKLQKLTA